MNLSLQHVLSPIEIGPIKVKNRVTRTGHATGLGGGTMSQTLIDYHLARAKGGVGLTILEALGIYDSAYPFLVAGAPGMVEGYRALMDAVAPHDMKIFQQIGHLGNEIPQADGSPPLSASDSIGAIGIPAEPMSRQQISGLIAAYVAAAEDCAKGRLDGVEVHMAHGYLIQQFMSPIYNQRTDEYGGSFENRMRLPLELLVAVREALPATMALGVRLSADLMPGGLSAEDIRNAARMFQDRKLIDYLNLTIGDNYTPHKIVAPMHEPVGYELPHDRPIREGITVPVLVTGRFRTLEEADQVIRQGDADLVALTRAHIADPDIVRKTVDGRVDEVRPCIACNHGCIGGVVTMGRLGCAVNVAVGAEAALAEDLIKVAENPRKVLVVGGGPAGLEAARIAALKGHAVILAEASDTLGGCINIAKRAPRRIGIGDITDWLEREVYRLGVDVRLGTYVQAADVTAIAPDVVIIATGSLPRTDDGRQMFFPGHVVAGMESAHVLSSHDVLLGDRHRSLGRHAVVFDDPGHYEGIAAAEFLVESGVAVTFVTGHPSLAPRMELNHTAAPALGRLAKGDFRLLTSTKLEVVEKGKVKLSPRHGGKAFDIDADLVVFVSHNRPNRELIDELEGFAGQVIPVGDVRSPRYLQTAIREGHLAARMIA